MFIIFFLLSQERGYIYTEKGVEIMVQIWGEVVQPGNYILPQGSTIIELISMAGGPTRYANLGMVKLVRATGEKRIVFVNVNKYLSKNNASQIPVLRGGDVVIVPHNQWYILSRLATFAAQLAAIVGVYYLIRGR